MPLVNTPGGKQADNDIQVYRYTMHLFVTQTKLCSGDQPGSFYLPTLFPRATLSFNVMWLWTLSRIFSPRISTSTTELYLHIPSLLVLPGNSTLRIHFPCVSQAFPNLSLSLLRSAALREFHGPFCRRFIPPDCEYSFNNTVRCVFSQRMHWYSPYLQPNYPFFLSPPSLSPLASPLNFSSFLSSSTLWTSIIARHSPVSQRISGTPRTPSVVFLVAFFSSVDANR